MDPLKHIAARPGRLTVGGAPEGYDAVLLAHLACARGGLTLFVARDDQRAAAMRDALGVFAPDLETVELPAWDCVPYDRISPKPDIVARRMAALALLALRTTGDSAPLILVTTVNAVLQRVPPAALIRDGVLDIAPGGHSRSAILNWLAGHAYVRAGQAVEPGEFAVRGGIVDLFPPGAEAPLRLDFFGETLETMKTYDAESQISTGPAGPLRLLPASEVPLDAAAVSRFRAAYVAAFGAVGHEDPLYEAVSAGRRHAGMEHWLPLFHETLETVFDYVGPDAAIALDHHAEDAVAARIALIADHFEARRAGDPSASYGAALYRPVAPDTLFLSEAQWQGALAGRIVRAFSPFDVPPAGDVVDAGGRRGRDFAPERTREENVFDALATHIRERHRAGKRVILACWSEGAADRLGHVLADHDVDALVRAADYPAALGFSREAVAIIVLGLEHGFETPDLVVVAEQDILGDRMIRPRARGAKRAKAVLSEASSLSPGDLVVHVDHGIGRYEGLKTLDVAGAPHDCLELHYDGGKLFLPVENIELVSRYGSDDAGVQLDRLGGSGWQSRKARLKNRIREMAARLIEVAAARALRRAEAAPAPQGLYDEFAAAFPYEETDDQSRAIAEVLEDLGSGRPMDRLICGDVGFGKTEVALRAAFVVAMTGRQVAVVVPTTLLARQHFRTFAERFRGWPLSVRQLSRFVPAKEAAAVREGLKAGQVDIVVGTHALLAKSVEFHNLGLVVVDEEQHFGVAHKERLKALRADVHVLTLTATPIPRTLQLALTGVREMSIIATPPVDRLAVRTFAGPFDRMIVREALLREHYRGGQSFFVVPRIRDLDDVSTFLREEVPELKFAVAHGQLAASSLEDVMTAFYERAFDVLVSTNIVESGLDIPTANTMVVHRADQFGLAQLYQLRGRIGRSKSRAYAYLTVKPGKTLTPAAEKRLKVLQSLDTLGAGFSLASHDLDIRGAGNLLGEEQSGHIREVGIELYQSMLEEMIASLRAGGEDGEEDGGRWSPQISIGAAVLIPETYVPDLDVRMGLYRRLANLEDEAAIDAISAELVDRFGPMPEEVRDLIEIVSIKRLCRLANVEKIDAGAKGAILTFRGNRFPNPETLVAYIAKRAATVKVRPDQKLVVMRDWPDAQARLKGARSLLGELSALAA